MRIQRERAMRKLHEEQRLLAKIITVDSQPLPDYKTMKGIAKEFGWSVGRVQATLDRLTQKFKTHGQEK